MNITYKKQTVYLCIQDTAKGLSVTSTM